MKLSARLMVLASMFAFGYLVGTTDLLQPVAANAQLASSQPLSEESVEEVKKAHEYLNDAMAALKNDNRYTSATQGINAFGVLAGGIDSVEDLESGNGVDPETFAALYAGMATDEIARELGRDDQGRLTYKNRLVRMYPISKLKQYYAERLKYSTGGPSTSPSPF